MSRTLLAVLLLLVAGCGGGSGAPVTPRAPQTIVLVSLDGFRWDYLDRPEASGLRAIAVSGVHARQMEPIFPTVTFPNHYTIVTGLWAEHHGIVGNTMVDPTLGRFTISDSIAVRTSDWWGGEPIWVTAEKQGRRSAAMFWPGSEAEIGGVRPTWYERYDDAVPYDRRIRKVLGWLALPRDSAPALITTYFSAVDGVSHRAGPDTPETRAAIARVDSAVTALWRGIQASPNAANVNLIVVADHGMAATSSARRIVLDDYLEPGTWSVAELNPVAMVTPAAGKVEEVFAKLSTAPHVQVYRKAQIPARWHFRDNVRIPEIIVVAEEGWVLATRQLLSRRPNYGDGGTHGYDNALQSMQAIFIGAGPAFAEGREVERVRNVDLYELMTSILGLRPAPNDGSIDSIRAVLR
ncbi:MAG TPA: ectonucleotide pyrophosphatase/phosphodiesterase [Gemmatimonadales bacterium]|nr:ectonucleotide pyrophosphatase/phosphodiesterase [Gemmatimonadales bacterium]